MTRRLALATVLAASLATPALAEEVIVFAAASLKDALDAVAADFQAETGNKVTISSSHKPAWAVSTRQRWLLPVTMAMAQTFRAACAASLRWVSFRLANDRRATRKKMTVEMAAARPKFWPESSKAMR